MKPPAHQPLLFDGRYYDQCWRDLVADVPYWIRLARRVGGPILELACGTGRVSIPLARQGFAVTGIDASDSMLTQARNKSAGAGVAVRWVKGDIRTFDLRGTYSLIIIPFNAIVVLQELADLEACLACVRNHLAPRGRFAIDVFNPDLRFLFRDPGKRYPHSEFPDPDGAGNIVSTETSLYDSARQVNQLRLYFKLPGRAEEVVEDLSIRIYFPQELDALLKYNGFAIENKFGNYDESPFAASSPKQLIVCSRNA